MTTAWMRQMVTAVVLLCAVTASGQSPEAEDQEAPEKEALPVELDFRYALDEPVLLDVFDDQGVTIEPRLGKRFLLAPLRYTVLERSYRIGTNIKVEDNEGKRCRVIGIAVGDASAGDRRTGRDRPDTPDEPVEQAGASVNDPTFSLGRGAGEPLYERIQPTLKDGEELLLWQNTRSPREKASADTSRRTRTDRSSGRSSGSNRDRSSRGSSRGAVTEKRGEMPASGWAALLIEYPVDALRLKVYLTPDAGIGVDLDLLDMVQPVERDSGRQPSQAAPTSGLAQAITPFVTDASPAMSRLAVAWLARQVSGGGSGGRGRQAAQPNEAADAIEAGLLAAIGSMDPTTAVWAWQGLSSRSDLTLASASLIANQAKPNVLGRLVEIVGAELSAARVRQETTIGEGRSRADDTYRRRSSSPNLDTTTTIVPSSLPSSTANPICYAVLQAVMRSTDGAAVAAAVRAVLTDGTQEGVACLADVPAGAKKAAVEALPDATSDEVRSAAIKTMLLTPVPETVKTVVESAVGIEVRIDDPSDPLLTLPTKVRDSDTQVLILKLLENAQMESVLGSTEFTEMISSLTGGLADKKVRQAAYKLLAAQWLKSGGRTGQGGVDAGQGGSRGGRGRGAAGTSMDALLAEALAEPDPMVQRTTATALLRTGRIDVLVQQLNGTISPDQVIKLLDQLTADPQARLTDEVLTLFGAMLGHSDSGVARSALVGIDEARKVCPAAQLWRLRLAVKSRLALDGLVSRLGDAKPDIAGTAASVATTLSGMETPTADKLRTLNKKLGDDPTGQYRLLLATQVQIPKYELVAPEGRRAGSGLRQLQGLRWVSERLVQDALVSVEKRGDKEFAVILGGKQIGGTGVVSGQSPTRGRRGQAGETTLNTDVGALVAQALRSAGADTAAASPPAAPIQYIVLGTWRGAWQSAETQQRKVDYSRETYRVDPAGNVVLGTLPQVRVDEITVWLEPVMPADTATK